MTDASDRVENDAARHRYVLRRGEHELGFAEYEIADGVITFTHTVIDREVQERGLGTALVIAALDDVRTSSALRVAATCPFVRRFLRDHPEYEDLTTR